MAFANALYSERYMLPVSEKNLKCQLHFRSENSQEVEDLKYRLDGSVVEESRSHTVIVRFQEELLSVRSDVDNYHQCPTLYDLGFKANITDGFTGILYILNTEVSS